MGLSAILTIAVLVPQLNAVASAQYVSAVIAAGLVIIALSTGYRPRATMHLAHRDSPTYRRALATAVVRTITPRAAPHRLRAERQTWRMPPLDTLTLPEPSRLRTAGMVSLRGYLVVAVVLLGVKTVQLALGIH